MLYIAMLIGGLIALFKGQITFTKSKTVRGWPARFIGLILIAPLPIQLMLGIAWGIVLAAQQKSDAEIQQQIENYGMGVDLAITLGCLVLAFILAATFSKPPVQPPVEALYPPSPAPPPSNNPYAPPTNPFAE